MTTAQAGRMTFQEGTLLNILVSMSADPTTHILFTNKRCMDDLRKWTKYSLKKVQNLIDNLETKGYIKKGKPGIGGDTYHFMFAIADEPFTGCPPDDLVD